MLGKWKKNNSHQAQLQESNKKKAKIVSFTLEQLDKAGKEKYITDLVFVAGINENGDGVLTCSRRDVYNHPPLGLVSRVQVVVDQDGKYDFTVLSTVHEYLSLCDQIAVKGGYKFCPGINPDT